MSPRSSEAQAQVGQGQRLPSTPLSCTPTDRGLAVCERRSVCVCAQLCVCVYCVKERCTPTPAVAEVSGNPPPISGSHPPPAWQSQPGWEVANLETWLLELERIFWTPFSLACITKLKVLLPCEGSMWSHLCGQHSATGGPPAAPMLAHSPGLATSTNLRPGLTTPTSYLGPRQLMGTGGPGQHVLAETYQTLPWLRPSPGIGPGPVA